MLGRQTAKGGAANPRLSVPAAIVNDNPLDISRAKPKVGDATTTKIKELVMYKHILIPTDGSDLSRKAIANGVGLAKALGAKITGLTVIAPAASFGVGEFGSVTDAAAYDQAMASSANKALSVVTDLAKKAPVSAETIQVTNLEPWKAIIETAVDRGCDLIVMASHGRRGVEGLLLGSETVKVLTHSKIPVLVNR